MSRHLLQRFAVWAAFAVALLVPLLVSRSAHAAILPLCEVDAVSMTPRAPAALPLAFAEEPLTRCSELSAAGGNEEDVVDSKIAAFCDARGASAIAPQRIHPINDARIDATPSCARLDSSSQTIAPSSHEGPAIGAAALLLDPAALGAATMIPPAASELLPAYAPVTDAECSGIEQAVYHPPR
ncbi:MAG: hypothetical protein ABI134_33465 [Byssovorax sp.]